MDIADKKELLLKALTESNGLISHACNSIGVCRKTYYNYRNSDDDFKSKADDILELTIDNAESFLFNRMEKGDTTAIIFYLKTKGRERGYTEKTELAVSMDGVELLKRMGQGLE